MTQPCPCANRVFSLSARQDKSRSRPCSTNRNTGVRDDPVLGPRRSLLAPEQWKAAQPIFTLAPKVAMKNAPATTAGARGSPYSLSLASFPDELARIAAERAAGLEWVDTGWA